MAFRPLHSALGILKGWSGSSSDDWVERSEDGHPQALSGSITALRSVYQTCVVLEQKRKLYLTLDDL